MTELTERLVMMRALDISFIAYICPVFFFSTRHTYTMFISINTYLAEASSSDDALVSEVIFRDSRYK